MREKAALHSQRPPGSCTITTTISEFLILFLSLTSLLPRSRCAATGLTRWHPTCRSSSRLAHALLGFRRMRQARMVAGCLHLVHHPVTVAAGFHGELRTCRQALQVSPILFPIMAYPHFWARLAPFVHRHEHRVNLVCACTRYRPIRLILSRLRWKQRYKPMGRYKSTIHPPETSFRPLART